VQNAAARLVTGCRRPERITPILRSLNWLCPFVSESRSSWQRLSTSDILVLKLISVLVFILFSSQNFLFYLVFWINDNSSFYIVFWYDFSFYFI